MSRGARITAALALAGAAVVASAHKPSDAYVTLTPRGDDVTVRWDVALRDLDPELGLDVDDDGTLSWGEVRSRLRDIEAYLLPQMTISAGGAACRPAPAGGDGAPGRVARHRLDRHSDGTYDAMSFVLHCAKPIDVLDVDYRLFAAVDPTHRGIVRLDAGGDATESAVLGPDHPRRRFDLRRSSRLETLREFVVEGIGHIGFGFDHILFLLSLLLPSVLVRADRIGSGRWAGAPDARGALVDVLKVVTAFTLAHSITLCLAVLDVVTLPSRLVESGIALTVILASVNNIRTVLPGRRWAVAFAFGLIHGFGFAAALKDVGLSRQALALSLFGFNLGVEIGQLAIVAAFFPVAFALRHSTLYRRVVLGPVSMSVAAIAGVWFVERAFDLKLMGFPA